MSTIAFDNQVMPGSGQHNQPSALSACPPVPQSLQDTGLDEAFIYRLIIKTLYARGVLSGMEIARAVAIPMPIIDTILDTILDRTYAEKRGGQGMGNATDRFGLTERGMKYCRELLEQDTYVGPAPVPLDQYWNYIREHDLKRIPVNEKILRKAWQGFIVDDALFTQIGPAVRSGKSCFLYGPPGTGKTTVAKKIADFLDQYGGQVAIPHAIEVGGSVIQVYDPVHHQKIEYETGKDLSPAIRDTNCGDQRWAMCRRPSVVVGGELTLDMLDLRYNTTTRFYEAPLQIKANGGVLIIDDFGRQLVRPKDLLNRWIVPLEERIDYLTLHTGKKFSIPFEQLVIFATNLDPNDLVDEAFLRRIRYKIFIGEPSFEAYAKIFHDECKRKNLTLDLNYLKTIIKNYYRPFKRPMRACDARDITDQIHDYCAFNDLPFEVPNELFDQIASAYLTELNQSEAIS